MQHDLPSTLEELVRHKSPLTAKGIVIPFGTFPYLREVYDSIRRQAGAPSEWKKAAYFGLFRVSLSCAGLEASKLLFYTSAALGLIDLLN